MRMKKVIVFFLILFTFLFISVGLGFITSTVFDGTTVKTITDLKYKCPNIDITKEFSITEALPTTKEGIDDATQGGIIRFPVYKKKTGALEVENTLPAGTNLVGKIAIDLTENELNMVKGAFVLLWIILIIVTVGCVFYIFRK